jgi:hypothetical protein
MELQRRKGCHVLFRATYDALMGHLVNAGWISGNSDAARRARAMGLTDEAAPAAGSAGAASALKPLSALEADDLLSADGDDSGSEDEASRASSRTSAGEASASASTKPASTAAATATVVDAFTTLTGMLASDFDDVALPAAQSIAALTFSKAVRKQLGKRATAALAAATSASPRITATGAPAGAATPTLPDQANFSVLQLFEALLARVGGAWMGDPLAPQRASLECRTAAALALVHLAKDKSCAEVLATMFAVPRLINGVTITGHSAASASLRRECLRASALLLGEPAAAQRAAENGCAKQIQGIKLACRDLDLEFDRLVDEVARRLDAAATTTRTPPITTSSPAAES